MYDCWDFMDELPGGRWHCTRCAPNQEWTVPIRAHNRCCLPGECDDEPPPPPANLEEFIAFRLSAGLATVPEEEAWRRYDICQSCEHLAGEPGDQGCARMECPTCQAALYLHKAITTDDRPCPENRFELLGSPKTASPAGPR